MENLLTRIKSASFILPKRQRQICNYILEHPLEASGLTIAEAADKTNVGTTTIIRFVNSLGYNSYNEYKKDLRRSILSSAKDTYLTLDELKQRNYQMSTNGQWKRYSDWLKDCREFIQGLDTPVFYAQLDAVCDEILNADHVYLFGSRSTHSAAYFLGVSLSSMMDNITILSSYESYIYDNLSRMTPKDLVLFFGSRPYASNTSDAIHLCRRLGIPAILITTDSLDDVDADCFRAVIACDLTEYGLIMTPNILVADMLLLEIGRRLGEQKSQRDARLNRILSENNLQIWEKTIPCTTNKFTG